MSDGAQPGRRVSRETRLLVVTIVVSAVVLLLLAQLRFPEAPPAVVTTTQPLERLAARASYDDLATSIARLEETIAPNLVALRLEPDADTRPRQLGDVLSKPGIGAAEVRHVPALRMDSTTVLAVVDPGTRISAVIGRPDALAAAGGVTVDPISRIGRVQVPEGPARAFRPLALSELRTPTYVVAVEGTRAGVTLRPIFLGRAERFHSARWTRPLLPLGGATVTPGALMFTLAGDFLGCAVMEDGTLAIAGAADVLEISERLMTSPVLPVDPGLSVQPLTGPLAAATGAPRGVVVSEVFEGSPADGVLEPGDVIIEIDGHHADAPEWLLLQLASRLSHGPVDVSFARDRKVHRTTLSLHSSLRMTAPWDDPLTLEPVRGIGSRVLNVQRNTTFETGGVTAGDIIVRVGEVDTPTPAQVLRIVDEAAPGDFLLLTVRRDDRQRVLAVQIPQSLDAARR